MVKETSMDDVRDEYSDKFDVASFLDREKDIVDKVYDRIRPLLEYRRSDLESLRPVGMKDRDWGLAIWGAERRMLEEGVVWQSHRDGVMRRASKVSQTIDKAARTRKAAMNKFETAILVTRAGRELTDDPDKQRQLDALEIKQANAAIDARHALRRAAVPRPKGI
jgi:hypothetical protein